jgi:hypothetical protein
MYGWSRDHRDDCARNKAASFSFLDRYALVKLAMVFAQLGIGRQRMRDVRPVSCITLYNVRYPTPDLSGLPSNKPIHSSRFIVSVDLG